MSDDRPGDGFTSGGLPGGGLPGGGQPDDEGPPRPHEGRTPAERAGATPLDPERFQANAGMPVVRRHRPEGADIVEPEASIDDPVVVRRPRATAPTARRRRPGSGTPWFIAAAVLAVVALGAGVLVWASRPDTEIAAGAAPELRATTPVLSARRAPDAVARPVAARNLRNAVDPVLATAPPDTCLEVRDGANVVLSHNPTSSLIPASNMKLLTAAAALDLLGPDTRLGTRFVTDGAPTDGAVVRGNLYMVGGGDPLLTTDTYNARLPNGRQPVTDIDDVADQIAATGITQITGAVVGDGTRYDAVRTTPSWPDRYFTQGQVAPLSALLVDDGWRTAGGPADDPDVHAAAVLTELLEARGIEVGSPAAAGVAPAGAAVLAEVPSLTIAELVAEMLRFSDNTTAELLVKEIGAQKGAAGSTAAGLDVLRTWANESGLPIEGVSFDDASGLSDSDRATCPFLASLLSAGGPDGTVANGLATPGDPGTLDDRLTGADLADRVRAKTGTLRFATALSGWLTTRPSTPLAFSIITNTTDRQVTAADTELQGRLLTAMLDYPASPDPAALSPLPPAGV